MAGRRSPLESEFVPSEHLTRNLPPATGWHPPLDNPATQIRLIYPHLGHQEDNIHLDLFCTDRDKAPPYIAISYTWGDNKNHKAVYINGHRREVWPNCHYALWQVRMHYSGSYVWIDSICIEQSNIDEKNHQVAMMGKVYESATLTCVCIGLPTCNSSLLSDFFIHLSSAKLHDRLLKKDITEAQAEENRKVVLEVHKCWETLHAQDGAKLFSALDEFMARPYWRRLWIVQEVMLSTSIVVLFGVKIADWQVVQTLHWVIDADIIGASDKTSTNVYKYHPIRTLMGLSEAGTTSFTFAMQFLDTAECSDVRDRVYALLGVIEWPSKDSPIAPDYRKTVLELAVTMTPYLDACDVGHMLGSLRITFRTGGMAELVRQRQQITSNLATNISPDVSSARFRTFGLVECLKVSADSSGRLRCSLRWRNQYSSETYSKTRASLLQDFENLEDGLEAECGTQGSSTPFDGRRPRPIYLGDQIAALGCCDLQDGDYIAFIKFPDFHWMATDVSKCDTFVILRSTSQLGFELVGQGFALPGYDVCRRMDKTDEFPECCAAGIQHQVQYKQLAIELSDENVVVLAAQDLVPLEEYELSGVKYDLDARLMRCITRVTMQSSSRCLLLAWEEKLAEFLAAHSSLTQDSGRPEVDDTSEPSEHVPLNAEPA